MKLQDSINLLNSTFKDFSHAFGNMSLPLLEALLIFILGIVFANLLQRLWREFARILNFEKTLLSLNQYKILTKFDKNSSLTEVINLLIWWGSILIFSFVSLELLGIKITVVFSQYLSLLPNFIISASFLLIGFLIAYFAYLIVGAFGALAAFPASVWVARATALAITVISFILALRTLGISEEMLRFIELAAIASAALSIGLAVKDLVVDLIKRVKI